MKKIFFFLLLLCDCFSIAFAQKSHSLTIISGSADFLKNGDTVKLMVYKYGLINQESSLHKLLACPVNDGRFSFKWQGPGYPEYVTLQYPHNPNNGFHNYIISNGDQIILDYKNNYLTVTGNQSSSFRIQYLMRKVETQFHHKQRLPEFVSSSMIGIFSKFDSIAKEQLDTLNKYKNELNANNFSFLANDINATWEWTKYYEINFYGGRYIDSAANPIYNKFEEYKNRHEEKVFRPDTLLFLSNNYLEYLIEKYKVDSCLSKGQAYHVSKAFAYFMGNYSGVAREQLLTATISDEEKFPKDLRTPILQALKFINNPAYISLFNTVLNSRLDGSKAYNFSLTDQSGKIVHLSSFKGKIVILDFWFTGCGNCIRLAPFMAKLEKKFKNEPVEFVGICADKNKQQFIKSVSKGSYVSPHIVNLYTNGNGMNDDCIDQYQIKSCPTIFVVSADGRLITVNNDPRTDNGSALSALINSCLSNYR